MYIRYTTKATHVERWGIEVPDKLKNAPDKKIKKYIRENEENAEFLDFVDTYDRGIENVYRPEQGQELD